MNKLYFTSFCAADNILYTGEEMRKYYERKGIAAKGRSSTRNTYFIMFRRFISLVVVFLKKTNFIIRTE